MEAVAPLVRFGTSTWTYEGWQGLVYQRSYPPGRFKQDCLSEYARFEYRGKPLFATVGFDQTFYQPPTSGQLAHFAQLLPRGFEVCSKVWEEITIPVFGSHPRYGKKAGCPNPHFLDPVQFLEILQPYREVFREHTGPFLLEFQRTGLDRGTLLPKLDRFFSALPVEYRYAVEVRNSSILGPDYLSLLKAHGVAHVYNHWTHMPPLRHQHHRLKKIFPAPFVVLRLLTPIGTPYQEAVKISQPYNRLVKTLGEMRTDAVGLMRQGISQDREVYVLVNNRAEGCAPLTVQALVDLLSRSGEQP
jgi:uncharacterized protein YecE (DUF72 family)